MTPFKRLTDWVKIFAWATAVAFGVRLFVVETFRIESDSMVPNLHDGDIVLTSKYNYNIFLPFTEFVLFSPSHPSIGSVVIHQLPDKPERSFIKRVVAVGGDTVQIRDGKLVVNNKEATYRPDGEEWNWEQIAGHPAYRVSKDPGEDFAPIEVPPGYFFVLGDNRRESIDSRVWGPLPQACLKAKLGFVWIHGNRSVMPPKKLAHH